MSPVVIRARFLKEERGFSLPEMLVTIVIMMVVFFALYSVFDMSVRIFMFGSNKVEAVESARLG
ncbi:MAG: prepilin-type N-terminal cleavage/methylation domain-containing protein, partial [Pyrinomonadaceae bacterium]|nr:prepilin-type N-terminal cleavage/methylation domain-containing protein [Pyrinomonadaceae bacterium]